MHYFVEWCDISLRDLNVTQTKEINTKLQEEIHKTYSASIIHGEEVENVHKYFKYLGTMFDSELKFDINTNKAQQQMHLLRKCKSFNVSDYSLNFLSFLYCLNLLIFSFICWLKSVKNNLDNSSKTIGVQMPNLNSDDPQS